MKNTVLMSALLFFGIIGSFASTAVLGDEEVFMNVFKFERAPVITASIEYGPYLTAEATWEPGRIILEDPLFEFAASIPYRFGQEPEDVLWEVYGRCRSWSIVSGTLFALIDSSLCTSGCDAATLASIYDREMRSRDPAFPNNATLKNTYSTLAQHALAVHAIDTHQEISPLAYAYQILVPCVVRSARDQSELVNRLE